MNKLRLYIKTLNLIEIKNLNLSKDELDGALLYTSKTGNAEILKFLIDSGANIHAEEDEAFLNACQFGHLEMVIVLTEAGANIHIDKDLGLIEAARNNRIEIVKYLFSQGCDIKQLEGKYHIKVQEWVNKYLKSEELNNKLNNDLVKKETNKKNKL